MTGSSLRATSVGRSRQEPAVRTILALAVLALLAPAQDSRPDTRPLAREKSPYLRQHLDNPVVWYPWGDEAFAKAARENKPVFLSIGYASCHWCHVMEKESFANAGLAALLNESFVAVKVDREERPDVDRVYMHATQMMTGRGGWPLSLFLTPDRKPFFAATYMPLEDGPNQTGFRTALTAIRDAWASRRVALIGSAERLDAAIKTSQLPMTAIESRATALESRAAEEAATRPMGGPIGAELEYLRQVLAQKKTPAPEDLLASACGQLLQLEDKTFGGFGEDQKFPVPLDGLALLRYTARYGRASGLEAVNRQYDAMARGGIHDHLAGGFHRYSTDRQWEVPHFEKMLYDQALIARVYLELFQAEGLLRHEALCRETLDYCLANLRGDGGGFIAALDATIDGEEGATYLWTNEELTQALGDENETRVGEVARLFGFDPDKPTEKRVLARNRNQPESRDDFSKNVISERIRQKLLEARNKRPQPARVGHVITAWNAWLVSSLARAGMVLNAPKYRDAALETMALLDAKLRRPDGLYARRWFEGEVRFAGELSDQAAVLEAMLDLHEMTLDPKWLERAGELIPKIVAKFGRPDGSFDDSVEPDLIWRTRETSDGATPSGASQMNVALARYARMTGKPADLDRAKKAIQALLPDVSANLADHAYGAIAWDLAFKPVKRVSFVGPAAVIQAMRVPLLLTYRPFVVMTSPPRIEPGIDKVRAHAIVSVDGKESEPLMDSAAILLELERGR